jgi:hypothetical protein
MVVDTMALSAQATGFVVWPLVDNHNSPSLIWLIPISLLLTSCGWWENFVSPNSSLGNYNLICSFVTNKQTLNGNISVSTQVLLVISKLN